MADKYYHVSPDMKRLFAEKQKQRAALRQEFIKQQTSPYAPKDPVFFDSGMTRFMATRNYYSDYFKPTGKSLTFVAMTTVIPIGAFFYFYGKHRKQQEHLIRTGQTPYEGRYLL